MILTRQELDVATCQNPHCDHTDHKALVLIPRCHQRGGTLVEYQAGVINVRCVVCRSMVATIGVAPGPAEPAADVQ